MQLSLEDADLFFRLHRGLMFYVNRTLKVIDEEIATPEKYSGLPPETRFKVHQALLDHMDLIDAFADENPSHFGEAQLEIVRSWKRLVTGTWKPVPSSEPRSRSTCPPRRGAGTRSSPPSPGNRHHDPRQGHCSACVLDGRGPRRSRPISMARDLTPMNDPPWRCLIVEAVGNVTIVRLRHREEIDPRSDKYEYTAEVGEELYRLADRPGRHRILLDLANFETLSHPAELAKLMSLLQKVKRSGGKLKLLCRSSTYPEIFRITRLDQVYEFYEDEVMALNSTW